MRVNGGSLAVAGLVDLHAMKDEALLRVHFDGGAIGAKADDA